MSNERDSDIVDNFVSQSYRQHSDEEAPEHLNQKILKLAASELKKRGTLSTLLAHWSKPLAWAVTIALSLAVVLQLTTVPEPAAELATDSLSKEFAPQDTEILEDAINQARLRAGPNQQLVHDDEVTSRSSSADRDAPSGVAAPAAAAASPPRSSVKPVLEETFQQGVADQQPGDLNEVDTAIAEPKRTETRQKSANYAVIAEKQESDAPAHCDDDARETAETWRACIEALSRSGATREAQQEYEAFKREFAEEAGKFEANK